MSWTGCPKNVSGDIEPNREDGFVKSKIVGSSPIRVSITRHEIGLWDIPGALALSFANTLIRSSALRSLLGCANLNSSPGGTTVDKFGAPTGGGHPAGAPAW